MSSFFFWSNRAAAPRLLSGLVTAGIVAALLNAAPARAQVFVENFDDFASLAGKGFVFANNSEPVPEDNAEWTQGNSLTFPAQSGLPESYVAAGFDSVAGETPGTISNWMLTPALTLNNGDTVSFYTRTSTGDFPDRLEVRLSPEGQSANVGSTADSVGDFATLLLTVNPDLLPAPDPNGYPTEWTPFTAVLSGLPSNGATGRIGFRYFVTDAGAAGNNGDYIGVDTLRVGPASVAPEPATLALFAPLFFCLVVRAGLRRPAHVRRNAQ